MCRALAIIGCGMAFAMATLATAKDDYCPASVTAKQQIQNAPVGWVVSHSNMPSALAGITLYNGPPSENVSLVYDKWSRRNGLAYAVWKCAAASKERIWLRCVYANTTVTLDKELPAGTSQCEVTYDPEVSVAGSPEVKNIVCK